jgi:hypothetical protein
MAVSMGMLRGEALCETVAGAQFVQHFPASAMPGDPAQRFGMLFAARPRWQLPDLEPYLEDLQVTALGTVLSSYRLIVATPPNRNHKFLRLDEDLPVTFVRHCTPVSFHCMADVLQDSLESLDLQKYSMSFLWHVSLVPKLFPCLECLTSAWPSEN